MEAVLVSGITCDKDQAQITLVHVPDHPGIAFSIFGPLAEAKIMVDMIVQNVSKDELTDMTFTVPRSDMQRTLEILRNLSEGIGYEEVLTDPSVAKVSVIGVGMRSHSGVASKAFRALAAENINIKMISTSEIKVTCLIEEKFVDLAERTLRKAFGLDKENLACEEA